MKKNWRWKEFKGYTFDRLIFKIAVGLVLAYCFLVVYSYNFDFGTNVYVKCDSYKECSNPYYPSFDNPMSQKHINKCVWDWCSDETIPAGFEFGEKPSALFNWTWLVAVLVVAGAFVLNHLIHNKGKAFPIGGLE